MDAPRPPRDRPPDVTSSALILIVLGVLGLFANTFLVLNATEIAEEIPNGSSTTISAAGILGLGVSSVEIAAGVMILRLSNAWRIVGIVIGALGAAIAVMNALSIGVSIGPVLFVAANVYVIVTLVRTRSAFSR